MMVNKSDPLEKKSAGGSPCLKESFNPDKIVRVIKNQKFAFLLDRLERYWNLKWIMYPMILNSKVSALEARLFSKWVSSCLEMIRLARNDSSRLESCEICLCIDKREMIEENALP